MRRIDTYPTHEYEGFKLRPGKPEPFGATLVPGGINFSVYSSHASACVLQRSDSSESTEIDVSEIDDVNQHENSVLDLSLTFKEKRHSASCDVNATCDTAQTKSDKPATGSSSTDVYTLPPETGPRDSVNPPMSRQ